MVDTMVRPRPGFQTIMMTDSNAGPNTMERIESQRRARLMKFPVLRGPEQRYDFDRFQDHYSSAFVKFDDDGAAPCRDEVKIVDPVSNFMSIGGEYDRNTGVTQLNSMQAKDTKPNEVTPFDPRPRTSTAARRTPAPPDEFASFVRSLTDDPGPWNGRKPNEASIRAKLGGWTSSRDPRIDEKEQEEFRRKYEASKQGQRIPKKSPGMAQDKSKEWRDQAALRYMYTPSTQRAYNEVDWDSKLAPKIHPPTTTLETQPDMVSHRFNENKRYLPEAVPEQALGKSWDYFQTRDGFFRRGPVEFCSQNKKVNQIPLYTGCIGGDDFKEKDSPHKFFVPFTVLRSQKPRYTETAHRPNIPGYTGCVDFYGDTAAHYNMPVPPPPSSARVYRQIPVTPNNSRFKRLGQMSKMITLVPPNNPFNRIGQKIQRKDIVITA